MVYCIGHFDGCFDSFDFQRDTVVRAFAIERQLGHIRHAGGFGDGQATRLNHLTIRERLECLICPPIAVEYDDSNRVNVRTGPITDPLKYVIVGICPCAYNDEVGIR